MSLAIPPPSHPFGGHIFTPTGYKYDQDHRRSNKSSKDRLDVFNYFIIIMTGMTFFIVLSWYNVMLVTYNAILGIPPAGGESTTTQLIATIGYAVVWTIIVILVYNVFYNSGLLNGNIGPDIHEASRVMNRADGPVFGVV